MLGDFRLAGRRERSKALLYGHECWDAARSGAAEEPRALEGDQPEIERAQPYLQHT